MFTIELTRGSSWNHPVETILTRVCDTTSLSACAAEARHWLAQVRREIPQTGITHYRIISERGEVVIEGSF